MATIPASPTEFQRSLAKMAVETMTIIFVLVEQHGLCFDELVRDAIERGERVPVESNGHR